MTSRPNANNLYGFAKSPARMKQTESTAVYNDDIMTSRYSIGSFRMITPGGTDISTRESIPSDNIHNIK